MAQSADDQGRRPEIQAPPSGSPTQTVGTTGTAIYNGYIQPSETDARLTGLPRYKTFSEMIANVNIVAAGMRHFANMCGKAEWRAEPADDTPRAQEMADKVIEILNDMETPLHRVVKRAVMYKFYGFGIQEWTAKLLADGTIGLLDVEARSQSTIERWDTGPHGKVLGAIQRSPQTFEETYIPREKFVYLVDDVLSDSPEGVGLLRHVVKAAARLQRYEQLEGFGFENDLRGMPILRAPLTELYKLVNNDDLTEAQRDALLQPLKNFIDNHVKNPALGMLLDSQTWQTADDKQSPSSTYQYTAELMDGGTYSLEEMHQAIRRITLEIARVLGVEHLVLGDGDSGSNALSKDKSDNFAMIVDDALKEIREAFTADLLKPLWELNGWPEELMPTLVTDTSASRDLESVSAVIRDLASSGVVMDREDEAVAELFSMMGLPRLVGQILADPDMGLGGSADVEETPERDEESSDGPDETPERDE